MFPHIVTVYNILHTVNPATIEDTAASHITILYGVLLNAAKAVSTGSGGQVSADAVTLYIPYDVRAVDGVTGAVKQYVPPSEFRQADDKAGLWTLAAGTPDTFFVKGVVVEPGADFQTISREHENVYRVTRVQDFDFGGDMRHWKVGGA